MNRLAKFLRDYSFARFFLPLGLILIIFGIAETRISETRKNYPQTDAVVSRTELYEEAHKEGDGEEEATYRIFVRYTVDGQEYEAEYGILPELEEGTSVRIDYNPDDPRDISQPTGKILPTATIPAGIAALAAAFISIGKTRKKNAALKRQEEGWKKGF